MQVWEYIAIFWTEPIKGEESTEVLLRKYPENVKRNIIEECKSNKLSASDLLNLLPHIILKQVNSNMNIEELMELNIGFIPRIIEGGR